MEKVPDPRIRPPEPKREPRLPTRAELALRARQLTDQQVPLPPVDLDAVARLVGITDIAVADKLGRSAILMAGPTGPAILVNRDDTPRRRRFSIAHEIGHQVIHPGQYISEGLAVVANRRGSDALERLCDYFAGCLLMPESWMRFRMGTAEQVARSFDVSVQAAQYRLRDLGR